MGCTAPLYRQRRARESPLWALLDEYGETVRRVWPERFEKEYGPWRAHWRKTIDGFLECGDLECGFARVRCSCGNEYLLPFSNWRHSGFGADASTGARQGDREGLHRLACYLHKAPFSLERMEYARGGTKVIYHGKHEAVSGRGTVEYDPLAFVALVLVHIPDPREIRVRYYGAASSTIRRGGRKGRLPESGGAEGPAAPEEESTYVKARRRTWAQLLARVYGVDPLLCTRCGGRMRIISFITDSEVVEHILRHVGLWGERGARGPPRGPPVSRDRVPGERRVVVDEYAQDFPPDDGAVEPEYEWRA